MHFEPAAAVLRAPAAITIFAWAVMAGLASAQVPNAPGQLLVQSVQGDVVTLSWLPPDNTAADGYVLEGGFAPDEVAASLEVGSDSTAVQVALAPGVYFIRSYALAGGERSSASNEVRVAVGSQESPSAPVDLSAVSVGSSVAVSWRSTFAGGSTERVDLEVTGPVSGTFELPNTGSFGVTGVPDGQYTLRVRARNQAGASEFTGAVAVSLPGRVPIAAEQVSRGPDESRLPVRFERFDMPRLAELRAREGLEAVIAGATSEFEAVIRLREWTTQQFPTSLPDPYPPWDAITILDWIRGGITGGFCGQYSQVLLQSLASFGVLARYVEIGLVDNPYAHYLVEFWSSDLRKWVVIDPSLAVYYERNGVALSALEVHDALIAGEDSTVRVVEGPRRAGETRASDFPRRTLELYYYVRYHLKANHLSDQAEHPFERFEDMIEFRDPRVPAWEASAVESIYPKEVLTRRTTTDRAWVNAPVSEIRAVPRISGPAQVAIDITTTMPDVAAAEYRILDADGLPGPWIRHYSPTLVWNVAPGDRTMDVRVVNAAGISGPTASVSLTAPAQP